MAEHLARIIGTEEDRVNCPFYWKIGACRHGDQCSRAHYKPSSSQTLVLRHMYRNPPVALAIAEGQDVDNDLADQAQDHFEAFYEEVFEELANYGQIEEIVVCDNIGDHMIGNLYVKYASEDDAERAANELRGRYYGGRLIEAEFSPVTDFREARCRQFVDGQCTRGGYCNFMHMKHVPRSLKRKMINQMFEDHPDYQRTAGMLTDDPSRGGGRYDNRGDSRRGDREREPYFGGRDRGRFNGHAPRYRSNYPNRAGGHSDGSPDFRFSRDRGGDQGRDYYKGTYPPRDQPLGRGDAGPPRKYNHSNRDDSTGPDPTAGGIDPNGTASLPPGGSRSTSDFSRGSSPSGGMKHRRQTSEERRAMIEAWNNEEDVSETAAK